MAKTVTNPPGSQQQHQAVPAQASCPPYHPQTFPPGETNVVAPLRAFGRLLKPVGTSYNPFVLQPGPIAASNYLKLLLGEDEAELSRKLLEGPCKKIDRLKYRLGKI